MTIESLSELFDYELQTAYFVETELVDALGDLASETDHEEVSRAFANHRDETREHVERLEGVFEARGLQPRMLESHALVGLLEDRATVAERVTDQDVLDLYNVGAGAKTEQVEIAVYDTLLTLARKLELGEDVIDPLATNRNEDEEAFKRLQRMAEGEELRSILERLL